MLSRQFLVFVVGGLSCALVDIGLMQFLLYRGIHPVGAASGGFLLGLFVNFFFHANLTFRSGHGSPVFLRFLAVVAVNYVITLGFVSLAVWMEAGALVGKVLSLPMVAINGFWLSKRWVFL